MPFIVLLFLSAPLIRTMRKVRHELWRLLWQYRHCCSDMWQTKQGDHPHGDLTEVIVGPENGQLSVKEGHVCVGEKVRLGEIWSSHISKAGSSRLSHKLKWQSKWLQNCILTSFLRCSWSRERISCRLHPMVAARAHCTASSVSFCGCGKCRNALM